MSVSFRIQSIAAAMVLVAGLLASASSYLASAQTPPELERIPFLIATGPVSGSYLPAGEAIAISISHPPGLGKCAAGAVCGPQGLIATTRSSSGSASNLLAVERESVQAALVQGDVLLAAYDGVGPFVDEGPLKNVRVLARLHDDALHVVVSTRSRVKRLKDLNGKRVAFDNSNSATEFTSLNLLSAAGVKLSSLKVRRIASERAADELRDGKLDAYFVTGVAPVRLVDQLTRRGYVRLLSADTRTLQKLTRKNAFYSKVTLPAGTYRSSKTVQALGIASVWVAHKGQDAATVQQILRAFWNPANQRELKKRGEFAKSIDHKKATAVSSAPLHEGAQRFYASLSR